eukprot:gb/GFBE01048117.1/.p1 GENE.gb/GFBE01048117.1/~~gb/GFBE01048117.1/.p1  ORF type:complete len:163 (+),score=17.37 gb/GFBE01048117.1/:1-489(+)
MAWRPDFKLAASPVTTANHVLDYIYDPSRKDGIAPMLGGNKLPDVGVVSACGTADQQPRDNRTDVLVFNSAKLFEDVPIVGAVRVTLSVSSTAKDTDFFVALSDVSADGSKAMLVRYGMMRMRWRNGGDSAGSPPMEPGNVYEIDVDLSLLPTSSRRVTKSE